MSAVDDAESKGDDELLSTDSESESRRSVIVEIAVPRPEVEIDRSGFGVGQWRQRAVAESDAESAEVIKVMDHARRFLVRVTKQSPVPLRASRAFVVDATSDELKEIAKSPLVRKVTPNRMLR
jgi:hypothetical protein